MTMGQFMFEERNGEMTIKQLLPKGWTLSDYSPTENLIEIEDEADGHRFWPSIKDLFRRDFKFDAPILIYQKNYYIYTHETALLRIEAFTRRKRVYLVAVFKPFIQLGP